MGMLGSCSEISSMMSSSDFFGDLSVRGFPAVFSPDAIFDIRLFVILTKKN